MAKIIIEYKTEQLDSEANIKTYLSYEWDMYGLTKTFNDTSILLEFTSDAKIFDSTAQRDIVDKILLTFNQIVGISFIDGN